MVIRKKYWFDVWLVFSRKIKSFLHFFTFFVFLIFLQLSMSMFINRRKIVDKIEKEKNNFDAILSMYSYKTRRKSVDNKVYEFMTKPKIHASNRRLAYFWFTNDWARQCSELSFRSIGWSMYLMNANGIKWNGTFLNICTFIVIYCGRREIFFWFVKCDLKCHINIFWKNKMFRNLNKCLHKFHQKNL